MTLEQIGILILQDSVGSHLEKAHDCSVCDRTFIIVKMNLAQRRTSNQSYSIRELVHELWDQLNASDHLRPVPLLDLVQLLQPLSSDWLMLIRSSGIAPPGPLGKSGHFYLCTSTGTILTAPTTAGRCLDMFVNILYPDAQFTERR